MDRIVRYPKKISKNEFALIPSCTPHKYGSEILSPWSIYWLHFAGENAAQFAGTEVSITSIDPSEHSRNDRRPRLFEEIYQNLAMGYSTENLEYASSCLWYLLGAFKYLPQFERIRSVQQHDFVEKSILYMQEHLLDNVDLSDLAQHCGYSVSHYSMVFKRKTSRSPIDYFINLKIQKACQLLDFTDMRINEIAQSLSFDDQFYFSRVFRRIINLSPNDYRKNKKG